MASCRRWKKESTRHSRSQQVSTIKAMHRLMLWAERTSSSTALKCRALGHVRVHMIDAITWCPPNHASLANWLRGSGARWHAVRVCCCVTHATTAGDPNSMGTHVSAIQPAPCTCPHHRYHVTQTVVQMITLHKTPTLPFQAQHASHSQQPPNSSTGRRRASSCRCGSCCGSFCCQRRRLGVGRQGARAEGHAEVQVE